jgi:hypothetical protein
MVPRAAASPTAEIIKNTTWITFATPNQVSC